MTNRAAVMELDRGIDGLLASHCAAVSGSPAEFAGLLAVAGELRHLPRRDFRAQLLDKLMRDAAGDLGRPLLVTANAAARHSAPAASDPVLPSLFASGGTYSVRPTNLMCSFAAHAAALALIATSGVWMIQHRDEVKRYTVSLVTEPSPFILPPAKTTAGGGGGGGDRDRLNASRGSAPKFAREQFTPPAVVLRNNDPKLPVAPTVVGPPDLKLPQMATLGDPLSKIVGAPSNGTGSGGGIGDGSGGGVGSGRGPGVGPGFGGGFGGGAYRVGGGVSAPRAVYQPDPEYSDEARKAKYQGVVVLWCVVGPDGRVHDVKVERSLGMGLDQKAIEAVKMWRFDPARKEGVPVAVQINIEVSFRLY